MDDIFDKLNGIDDDENLCESVLLKDALDDAIVVMVDDARTYDIQQVVDEFAKDHMDEEPLDASSFQESYERNRHILISPNEGKELLEAVIRCRYFDIKKHPENIKFIKQLAVMDSCYTLESTNKFHNGALLTVFITDKKFKLKDRVLAGVTIYAKIAYTTEGFVCVVSIHDTDMMEPHPYM